VGLRDSRRRWNSKRVSVVLLFASALREIRRGEVTRGLMLADLALLIDSAGVCEECEVLGIAGKAVRAESSSSVMGESAARVSGFDSMLLWLIVSRSVELSSVLPSHGRAMLALPPKVLDRPCVERF